MASGEVGRAQQWRVGSLLQFQHTSKGMGSTVLISHLQLVLSGRYKLIRRAMLSALVMWTQCDAAELLASAL